VDIGNIWMLDEDPKRPGSGFSKSFLSELAIGAGMGARLDFDFFLVRFDFGLQLKDPSKIPGERWLWDPKTEYNQFLEKFYPEGQSPGYSPVINFNLGIGYPF
jgi:outer membrane protein assembly factor BamA